MQIGEEVHDLSATFERLTSAPVDTTTSPFVAPELMSTQLRATLSTVSRDVPRKEGSTYCVFCERFLNGNGHSVDCLVKHFFPGGARAKGINGLSPVAGVEPRTLGQIKAVEAHMLELARQPSQTSGLLPLDKLVAQRHMPDWAQWAQRQLNNTDTDLVAQDAAAVPIREGAFVKILPASSSSGSAAIDLNQRLKRQLGGPGPGTVNLVGVSARSTAGTQINTFNKRTRFDSVVDLASIIQNDGCGTAVGVISLDGGDGDDDDDDMDDVRVLDLSGRGPVDDFTSADMSSLTTPEEWLTGGVST